MFTKGKIKSICFGQPTARGRRGGTWWERRGARRGCAAGTGRALCPCTGSWRRLRPGWSLLGVLRPPPSRCFRSKREEGQGEAWTSPGTRAGRTRGGRSARSRVIPACLGDGVKPLPLVVPRARRALTSLSSPASTPCIRMGAEGGLGCRDRAWSPGQSAPGPSACPRSCGQSCPLWSAPRQGDKTPCGPQTGSRFVPTGRRNPPEMKGYWM